MTFARATRKSAIAAAAFAAGAALGMAVSGFEARGETALDAGVTFRPAQFTYPWESEKKDPAPKRTRPAKPSREGETSSPPSAAAAPAGASSIEEVAYKGHRIRALHYASASELHIELNGKVIGTVRNVGQFKKPHVLPGTYHSLVTIWTRNAAGDCSSNVLATVPMSEDAGGVEVKSGFGACNTSTRQLSMKRGNWEVWSLIAYREDSAKVSVAVSRNGRLAITEQIAKPCLFSKDKQDGSRCTDEYVAAGLGSTERGIQSGEERAGGRRLATFQNRAKSTGSIELDGKIYKAFTDVKAFHVESSVALPDSALFSIWLQPASETCGYRMLLRVATAGGQDQTLNRVGACRPRSITRIRRRPDNTVSAFAKIMWGNGGRDADIAAWSGGSITVTSVQADACLFGANVTNDCIDRILPAGLFAAAPGPIGSKPSIAPPGSSRREQIAQNPAVLNAFRLLAKNQIDSALAEFDRALIAEPGNAWAYTGRGYGLALKGKLDNAMTDLDRAVQLNPRSAHAYSYRGFVFLLRREPDRALAQLDQALRLDARLPEAYAFRGSAYLAKGNTDQALTDLNKSIEIMPKNSVALGMRARAYATRKEHPRAVDDFTAAMTLAPNSISYRFGRGQSLEALGRTSEAVTDYTAAAALKPATLNDIATQALARQRLVALSGGTAPTRRDCPRGQTCL